MNDRLDLGSPEATPSPTAVAIAPGYELPTARQVVGRGLQLAYDASRDIRGASIYVGLLMLLVAGPAAALLVADLPRLSALPWSDLEQMTDAQARDLLALAGPLYGAAALALLGLISVSVDGLLMAVSLLGARAVGRPLGQREALGRARQVFWRYGFAAFVVGVLSSGVSGAVGAATGSFGHPESIGASLFATFIATMVVAPFGYIATAVVIGDVNGAAALGGSIRLMRARPWLIAAIAAFAFAAGALQTFGLGVALDIAGRVADLVHPDLDPSGGGLLALTALVGVALVAFGSLNLTVSAITAAPQVTAFLGLTHYSAGLDRARTAAAPVASPADGQPAEPAAGAATADAPPAATYWTQAPPAPRGVRLVTLPMVVLIGLEAVIAAAGIAAAGR